MSSSSSLIQETATSQESPSLNSETNAPRAPRLPVWLRITPFFLSALFFLSAFFAVFSPLPILLVGLRSNRWLAWLAMATNTAIIGFAGGMSSIMVYGVFVVASSLAMLEVLLRADSKGRPVDRAAFAGLIAMVFASVIAAVVYFRWTHSPLWADIQSSVSSFVDYMAQSKAAAPGAHMPVDPADFEDWKKGLLTELPSAIAILGLVLVWVNLSILVRFNPRNLRERLGLKPDFFLTWKAPEYLVWPTIAAGASLLYSSNLGGGGFPAAEDIGRNAFKFLMAVYAIQGLSILGFFFEMWKLRRFLRLIGYSVAVLVMMPLLLSLGFFDLWFDFRSKFRQS